MQCKNITWVLNKRGVNNLSESEKVRVETHVADCPDCMRVYKTLRLSAFFLRARAAETTEPSPFFSKRVMATIRVKELPLEPSALVRMWRAAGALVSAMAMLVVILVGLTLFSYDGGPQVQVAEAAQNIYSPEYVVLEPDDPAGEGLPYDIVLATMYDSEETDGYRR
jgi:predicted anti-sigma-YlaC factor YlaD